MLPEDRPSRTPPTTLQLLARADAAAEPIGALCRTIHSAEGELSIRRIQGIMALARRVGAPAVSEACSVALELGVPTYRFVRRYVERHPPPQLMLKQVDPLIRELTLYRDVIVRKTKETP